MASHYCQRLCQELDYFNRKSTALEAFREQYGLLQNLELILSCSSLVWGEVPDLCNSENFIFQFALSYYLHYSMNINLEAFSREACLNRKNRHYLQLAPLHRYRRLSHIGMPLCEELPQLWLSDYEIQITPWIIPIHRPPLLFIELAL